MARAMTVVWGLVVAALALRGLAGLVDDGAPAAVVAVVIVGLLLGGLWIVDRRGL
jgi:hypothetical protein